MIAWARGVFIVVAVMVAVHAGGTDVVTGKSNEAIPCAASVEMARKVLAARARADDAGRRIMLETAIAQVAAETGCRAETVAAAWRRHRGTLLADDNDASDTAERIIALRERAMAQLRSGDLTAAEETAGQVLALSVAEHGGDAWPTIAIYAQLAAIHEAQDRWTDAVAAYEQEITRTERRLGARHLVLARRLLAYAAALRKVGRNEDAREAEVRGHEIYAASEPEVPGIRDP